MVSTLSIILTIAQADEILDGPVPAVLLRVIDGDSLEVEARIWLGQHLRTHVRLAGIDAPELRGACASERELARRAAERLAGLIARQPDAGSLRLYDLRNGKFAGRVVARVETAEGQDLGRLLAAEGLARPYAGGRRSPWCDLAGPGRSLTNASQ